MNQIQYKSNKKRYKNSTTTTLLVIGILCVAANLRAPLTSVGPIVGFIRGSLHMSDTLAGMITTLPLFAFALCSPLAPKLARKFGTEVVIFCSLIILTIGILMRSWLGYFGLFLGTVILGLAISVGNVLIPGLIKKEFPKKIGIMTGAYSSCMNVFAALASGISLPLASDAGLGWNGSLQFWAILSFVSMAIWFPQLRKKHTIGIGKAKNQHMITRSHEKIEERANESKSVKRTAIWKLPLAWQVTIYMGLQSMVFYCMVAWLPNILIQQGMDNNKAGWMLSLMQFGLIPMTFLASVLAGKKANQRMLVVVGSMCVITGLLGLLLFGGSSVTFLWIIILGIGGGITFSIAMMFFSSRTANADEAANLSGMAQSIGYLLAAFGPMFFGYMHDITSTWTMPLILLIVFAILCLFSGIGASRDVYLNSQVNKHIHNA